VKRCSMDCPELDPAWMESPGCVEGVVGLFGYQRLGNSGAVRNMQGIGGLILCISLCGRHGIGGP